MAKVILVDPIHILGQKVLTDQGIEIIPYKKGEDNLLEHVADADAIIVRTSKITAEVIDRAPNLQIISRHGAGTDNIDKAHAGKKNIYVVNTPDANTVAVAEHVFAFMMELSKKISWCDQQVKKGEWSFREQFKPVELQGQVLGLLGFGRIGRDVAHKAGAFGMRVLVYDPYVDPASVSEDYITFVDSVEDVLQQADFVSLHVPSTSNTVGMIGAQELAMMKPTAFLLNLARGSVVRDADLAEALKNGVIAGAAMDVFEPEPPPQDHPFFSLPNILLTPHNAALTGGAMIRAAIGSAEEVVRCLSGQQPLNIVNKKELGLMK